MYILHAPNLSVANCITEGVLVRRARTGQFFWLLLIPTPVLGVDSTPRMGEWVGEMGQFGIISPRGLAPFRFGIWTGPFPIGDLDWLFSNWGEERPLSLPYCPPVTQCDAF